MAKYSVLLPTYNERENLPIMVYLLNEVFSRERLDWEVIVIDDNSPDRTDQVCRELQKVYGEDKVVLKPRRAKLGLGTAYVHGLKYAKGDFIFIMDSDLSHHPKFIPRFIERQRQTGCDVVTGSRYIRGGGVYGWNLKRKAISVTANHLAATLLQTGVRFWCFGCCLVFFQPN
jgi:dolichol-phosphate mannosyltransferase